MVKKIINRDNYKMKKGNQTSFKKGQIANPKGRPVGSFSPLRKQLIEVRKTAIKDVDEIYEGLKEKMRAGEAWAYQIYFKELVSMPKEWLNEIDITHLSKDLKTSKDFQRCLISIFQSLINNETMSQKEAVELIKSFNKTEINDSLSLVESLESSEEREARMEDIRAFTLWKEERVITTDKERRCIEK